MGACVAVSKVHTNLTVPCRIVPAGTELYRKELVSRRACGGVRRRTSTADYTDKCGLKPDGGGEGFLTCSVRFYPFRPCDPRSIFCLCSDDILDV